MIKLGYIVLFIILICLYFITSSTALSFLYPMMPIGRSSRYFHSCNKFKSFPKRFMSHSSGEATIDRLKDEGFMKLAIRHAQAAYREREVPIGAVLVNSDGIVVAACRNQVEAEKDASAHAEINCLRKAAKLQSNWRLLDCTLYTTLEPCPMCLSAIQNFRVKRLVYGARDIRLGSCGSFVNLLEHPFHKVEITGGVLEEESSNLLKRFFQGLRKEKERYGSHDLGRGMFNKDFET